MNNDEQKTIQETITAANVFELVKKTFDKIGLERMAPIEPSRLDEIISKSIVAQARG